MYVLTMPTFHGRSYRPLNAVIHFETVGIATWRDWVTKIVDIVGGRADTYSRPTIKSMETSLEKLQRAAADIGGEAIIDLRIQVMEVSSKGFGMSQLLLTGTAIVFEEEMPVSRPAMATTEAVVEQKVNEPSSRTPPPSAYGFLGQQDVPQLGSRSGSSKFVE
ncbi:MAG: heavy metal-binding domain-containing protein [Nitrospirota bacterium]|nr:heavy metal-binding domain-containing protein [Nitrospirota bacterium]